MRPNPRRLHNRPLAPGRLDSQGFSGCMDTADQLITATITATGARSTYPDDPQAVDADIFRGGTLLCGVTLRPHAATGDLDAWGDTDNWCSDPSVLDEDGELRRAIVAAVVAAAEAADRPDGHTHDQARGRRADDQRSPLENKDEEQ